MGTGDANIDHANGFDREASTTLLLLVALRSAMPKPMSTYELGLVITDNKNPPRPLSVLVKTLAKDRYIERSAAAGKRAGYWTITQRGLASLERRPAAAELAAAWIEANPNYTESERAVMASLLEHGPQPASKLASTCDMLHSPIRTALKRLSLRRLVDHPMAPSSEYSLSAEGKRAAQGIAPRT